MALNETDNSKNLIKLEQFAQLNHDLVSLEQLEFHYILQQLHHRLTTPYGKQKLSQIRFFTDISVIRTELEKTAELANLLSGGYTPPMSDFTDISALLERIKPKESHLEATELNDVKRNLEGIAALRNFLNTHKAAAPTISQYAPQLHVFREITDRIQRTIDRSGEIYDNASPELRQIRVQIRTQEHELKKVLQRVQKNYADYLQDGIVTMRDGRMVLGIQPNFVNRVNGIVHGTSASGATVFIEPMETLKISNEIQNLRIAERVEIIKILKQLTAMVREFRNPILFNLEIIAIIDLILAKARLSQDLDGQIPQLNNEHKLTLQNARHPLLLLKYGQTKVVPLNVTLGENFSTLVITGPNAGGKTVTMKTVGLMTLMVQLSILIPADSKSNIPIISNILVDIGDRQSIEQDLSTFSAHILRLKHILENATENSLILLDEVGTGTDPKEGSALAIAILTELTERKCLTIATTHHGELKAFAHEHPGVENASMEFDLQTLEPTYRLRVGIPGSSYAIEIARRYGFPQKLIDMAKNYIGSEKDRLEDLILTLEKRLQEAEQKIREASIKLSKAEALQQLYERQLENFKKDKQKLKREAEEAAYKILRETNALIENTVREIRESQGEKRVIKQARANLQKRKAALEKMLQSPNTESAAADATPLKKGDTVWVESLNDVGELLDNPDGRKKVRVLVGNVTLTVDVSRIRPTDRQPKTPKPARSTSVNIDDIGTDKVLPELDLRGMDTYEAIEATDLYLSQALESGWEEVRIVHGKGTGTLRQAVNNFLAKDKRVESKRLGNWGEGDTGVTVVKLRTSS
jgi:DNA mismatch repair protein MutS2